MRSILRMRAVTFIKFWNYVTLGESASTLDLADKPIIHFGQEFPQALKSKGFMEVEMRLPTTGFFSSNTKIFVTISMKFIFATFNKSQCTKSNLSFVIKNTAPFIHWTSGRKIITLYSFINQEYEEKIQSDKNKVWTELL